MTSSRRRFMVAAAAAAMIRRRPAAAAEPWQPRWILASALYGDFPLAEILPEAAKVGAGLIDLWPKPHGTQREEVDTLGAERVREMLAAAGVKLGGIACYRVGPFKLAGEFAIARQLGAEQPVLVTTAPGDGTATGDALVGAIKTFLGKLGPSVAAAEEAGGVIAIENHSKSLLQTPEGIRRFAELATHERVGVALAPHHLPQDAELVAGIARDLGPKVKFVYAQQHGKGSKEKLPKEDELLQMPGRGPLDFAPLMRELAAMRFTGPVEIFMHPVPRGVPILGSVAEITAEINRARDHLLAALP
ncbi:MAG: sugar phosphate isomerase/epimerase family protein [Planctomycetota bacterium]